MGQLHIDSAFKNSLLTQIYLDFYVKNLILSTFQYNYMRKNIMSCLVGCKQPSNVNKFVIVFSLSFLIGRKYYK